MVLLPVPGLPTKISSLHGVIPATAAWIQERTSETFLGGMQRSDALRGAYFSTQSAVDAAVDGAVCCVLL
jgi:hypothetical protein